MIEFEELDRLLVAARAGSRAAECHGFLCGYICTGSQPGEEFFRKFLLAEAENDPIAGACCRRIAELASAIRAQIRSPDLQLQLLLPDDDRPLMDRGIALTEWCQGFLSGLGMAGILDDGTITGESGEVIEDLYQICRLDTDAMVGTGEEAEAAFFELTEYVRMGVILIHDELAGLPVASDGPKVLH